MIDCGTEHVTDLANTNESAQDDVTSPPHLMKLSDWETHNEWWLDFLAQHCNPTTGVVLIYILHESVDIPAEIQAKSYPTINDDLIATMAHSGHEFCINNQHASVFSKNDH